MRCDVIVFPTRHICIFRRAKRGHPQCPLHVAFYTEPQRHREASPRASFAPACPNKNVSVGLNSAPINVVLIKMLQEVVFKAKTGSFHRGRAAHSLLPPWDAGSFVPCLVPLLRARGMPGVPATLGRGRTAGTHPCKSGDSLGYGAGCCGYICCWAEDEGPA